MTDPKGPPASNAYDPAPDLPRFYDWDGRPVYRSVHSLIVVGSDGSEKPVWDLQKFMHEAFEITKEEFEKLKDEREFQAWLVTAREENPQMTDEQLRAGWEAAEALIGNAPLKPQG